MPECMGRVSTVWPLFWGTLSTGAVSRDPLEKNQKFDSIPLNPKPQAIIPNGRYTESRKRRLSSLRAAKANQVLWMS